MSKIKKIDIDTGRNHIIYLHKDGIILKKEGFKPLNRVKIFNDILTFYGTLHIIENDSFLNKDEIGLSKIFFKKYNIKEGDIFTIKSLEIIPSFNSILSKLDGNNYEENDLNSIFDDIIKEKYDDSQIACFCASTSGNSLNEKELMYLTKAMIKKNTKIDWNTNNNNNKNKIIVDKHCIGGIPGNRTTLPSIAIIAEYGMLIPKTSTRSITSPSGTIDTMEVFTNVYASNEKIKEIVNKTNGCIIWSGNLSPIDDIVMSVQKDLSLDGKGLMIASIISKKMTAGSNHILIDIPYGPQSKCKNIELAKSLKFDFETLGKNLGLEIYVHLSEGNQPIGNGIGPALEANDILKILKNENDAPIDLKEKIIFLSGIIIEFDENVKKGEGKKIAKEILESGRAYERFKKICEAQGGFKNEISMAKFNRDFVANFEGKVCGIDIKKIDSLARLTGCPDDKEAGIYIYKHLNDYVKKGEKIMTIYSNSIGELNTAFDFAEKEEIFKIMRD
jgi:thymidine phosphorylase